MDSLRVSAGYTSYSVHDFEATRAFYESKLGCTPVAAWDRPDGRGVYYQLDGIPVAEILAAPHGGAALAPPPAGAFSTVLIVSDARRAHDELVARGVTVTTPLVSEAWGNYFGIADPDGVPLYFVEQSARAGAIRQ